MIPRYSRPEMANIFEQENKFKIWLEVETLALEKMAEMGTVPDSAAKALREKGNFDVERINEIEAEVKHDVIAFLTSVAEFVGEDSRYVHQGMTSSDLIDTSFAYQLKQAADILIADLDGILDALKKRIEEHRNTLCIGRSHGIHAEPTTFGLKLAGHYCAFKRAKQRLETAQKDISVCAMSGAVGTYATLDPEIEAYVAEKLGLQHEMVSTQVIPRDRHAMFFATLGVIASSIENFAVEIRHLQRSEVREAEEFFSKGQKGSSAMPHKRNPILSENLTGLARMVRSYTIPALENIALWHERDISHSSVERNIGPDSTITLDFALFRLKNILKNMNIYPKKMLKNLNLTKGLIFSQRVMLELTKKGFSREYSYKVVQKHSTNARNKNISLLDSLKSDKKIYGYFDNKKLKKIFDLNYHTRKIGLIFDRVFN